MGFANVTTNDVNVRVMPTIADTRLALTRLICLVDLNSFHGERGKPERKILYMNYRTKEDSS
jgi:hypothetical protein